MKKRRLFGIFLVSFFLIFLFVLSSSIFKLKYVEVVFVDSANLEAVAQPDSVYATKVVAEKVVSSGEFEYGMSIFVQNKKRYLSKLEKNNSFLKVENIFSVFPNKIIVNVSERKPLYYLNSSYQSLILDKDFKVLAKMSRPITPNSLILIDAKNSYGQDEDFFSLLNLSAIVFEAGDFLTTNNLILGAVSNFEKIFISYFEEVDGGISKLLSRLQFCEVGDGDVNLLIYTSSTGFGVKLSITDIFSNFDYKLSKLLKALKTLATDEKIKSTYGTLAVDQNLNCSWNKL